MLAYTSGTIKEQAVRLAHQPYADGQPLGATQLLLDLTEGLQVIGHLLHVVGVADLESSFLIEQIGQCGLRALDPGWMYPSGQPILTTCAAVRL